MKLDIEYNKKKYNLLKAESDDKEMSLGFCGLDLKLKKPKILK